MTTLILNLCVGYVEQLWSVFVQFCFIFILFLAWPLLSCFVQSSGLRLSCLDLYVLKNLNKIEWGKKKKRSGIYSDGYKDKCVFVSTPDCVLQETKKTSCHEGQETCREGNHYCELPLFRLVVINLLYEFLPHGIILISSLCVVPCCICTHAVFLTQCSPHVVDMC